MVSHDERLISLVCEMLWWCHDHQVTVLEGGIKEYRRLMEMELRN
jgi:ATPase subunit of ABC transporter with duplicated ATPase domains